MAWLQHWDMILIGAVSFVAVVALVRLMAAERDELVAKLRAEMQAERQRLYEEEQAAEKAAKSRRKKGNAA